MVKFSNKLSKENLGILLAISSSLFIAIEVLVVDYLFRNNPQIDFFNMFFWSFLGLFLISSIIFLRSRKSILKVKKTFNIHRSLLIKDSLLSTIAISFYFLGIYLIGSGSSSIFSRSGIIFTIILSILFLNEKISKKEFFLAFLMISGFLLYQNNYEFNSILGIFIVLLSNFFYSLISLFIKKEHNPTNPFYYAYLRIFLVLILITFSFFTFIRFYLELNFIGLSNFLILSFGCFFGGILSRATSMSAINKIELHEFGIIKNLDIFFILICNYLFFSQTYSFIRIFGVILVFISIVIYALSKKK